MWNKVQYPTIIRDHDRAKFEERKEEMKRLVALINAEYGEGTAALSYATNIIICAKKIEPVMHIIDTAFSAMEAVGVKPNVKRRFVEVRMEHSFHLKVCLVRISFAGGLNFHGRYEFIPIPQYGEGDECHCEDCRTGSLQVIIFPRISMFNIT